MSHLAGTPQRPSRLRRYGPLTAILVVVAVIAAVAVLGRGSSTTPAASDSGVPVPSATTSASAAQASFKQAISFAQAKAAGTAGSIDWGSRCNVKTGKLAYPSFFAGSCYAPFHGDNGGATATGVSAKVIKVVFYVPQSDDPFLDYILSAIKDPATNAQTIATMQDWVAFYNHFFETYGRTVKLIPFTATGVAADPIAARADAVTIATNIKPFAVWGGPALTPAFADELAARQVLCIDCGSGNTNSYFQQRSPYVWSLGILPEQGMVHVAEFLRKQVAGHKASFAGETDLTGRTRRFGVVALVDDADSRAVLDEFKRLATADKLDVARYVTYSSPTELPAQAPALIARLKASGVTSVVFAGDPVAPQALTKAATAQNWFPEWIISGSALTDTAAFGRSFDQRQWAHAFGVTFGAARTGITGSIPLYHWWTGHAPPDISGAALSVIDAALFFPVIQGIGPDLTAENFRTALFASGHTPHALTQPSLSWGRHGIWPGTDYGGTDDATEVWWNAAVTGPDELGRSGKGLYEYVDGGRRYLPGHWAAEPTKAFNPHGAVAIYTTPPPGERTPHYPSPARP